jgi:hypothetical protein
MFEFFFRSPIERTLDFHGARQRKKFFTLKEEFKQQLLPNISKSLA